MINYPIPPNEAERLSALRKYNILDSLPEEEYQDIVSLASSICETPISLITLIDEKRQWFKAKFGIDGSETERKDAFCSHTIMQNDIFEVEDALQDSRFADNPYVLGDPYVRFYAGIPVTTYEGFNLGSLCVIDTKPKNLSDFQKRALELLMKQVASLLESRLKSIMLEEKNLEIIQQKEIIEYQNDYQRKVLSIISHDLRSPLVQTYGVTQILTMDDDVSESVKLLAKELQMNTQDALNMLDTTLSWAKSQQNGFVVEKAKIELDSLMEKIIIHFGTLAQKKNISFHFDYPNNKVFYADKFILESIIRNLLSNAFKFTPIQGSVKLHLSMEKDIITIAVEDSGIGIPKTILDSLTIGKPLTARYGTSNEKGAGVGLQLLQHFIKLMEGRMIIQSELEKGSTFIVSLPML